MPETIKIDRPYIQLFKLVSQIVCFKTLFNGVTLGVLGLVAQALLCIHCKSPLLLVREPQMVVMCLTLLQTTKQNVGSPLPSSWPRNTYNNIGMLHKFEEKSGVAQLIVRSHIY